MAWDSNHRSRRWHHQGRHHLESNLSKEAAEQQDKGQEFKQGGKIASKLELGAGVGGLPV